MHQQLKGKKLCLQATLVCVCLFTFLLVSASTSVCWANVTFGGSKRKVWTDKPDWDGAKDKTRITTSNNPGQIEIDPNNSAKVYSTPYLYIPNSASNTLSQIDTRTGKTIWTIPLQGVALDGDPSRTTVDVDGNVWVGLRRSNKVILVTKDGKVSKEIVTGGVPRAITVDLDGNIWVGNWADNTVVKLDGATGKHLFKLKIPCAYGAVTDIYGNIWFVNRCRQMTLTKVSSQGQILGIYPANQGYGIASDSKGQIWLANYEKGCVYRYTNKGKNLGCIKLNNGCIFARGVAVDGDDNIWVACSNTPLVVKLSNTGRILGVNKRVGLQCVGLAVDSNGFIWAISRADNTATKIDTKTLKTVGSYSTGGIGPYTYSDMTGFQFQRVANSSFGVWRDVFQAPCVSKWKKVFWSGKTPHGSSVVIRARTAASRGGLAKAEWSKPLMKGADPQLPDNQWIEIEVYLRTFDRSVTPSISDLTVEYDTSGKESCNGIDDDCDGYIDNMPNTNQPLLQRCKTNCGSGLRICDGGQWKTCNSPSPTKETCNGRDDDCDGDVDEDAKCIDGSTCYGGACTSECKPSCPQGTTCKTIEGKSLCIGDGNCKTLQDDCLKEKKICRNGRCVDPCAGVLCPDGQNCFQGVCETTSCFNERYACSEGQICKDGKCIDDPCSDSPCNSDETCNNGKCYKSCATVQCSSGKSCKQGKCVTDSCADVSCVAGAVCSRGKCYKDPCLKKSCPNGEVCILGECKTDPCIGVDCPKQQVCRPPHGDCYPQPFGQKPQGEISIPPDGIPWSPPVFDGGYPPKAKPDIDNPTKESSIWFPTYDGGSTQPPPNALGCNCERKSVMGPLPPVLFLLFLAFLFYRKLRRDDEEA